jgi:hypothetical protein
MLACCFCNRYISHGSLDLRDAFHKSLAVVLEVRDLGERDATQGRESNGITHLVNGRRCTSALHRSPDAEDGVCGAPEVALPVDLPIA